MHRLMSVGRGLQFFETQNEGSVFAVAFRAFGLNGFKDGAETIEQLEKASDEGPIGDEFAFAQKAEQVFAGVREFFKALEAEETGSAFDGVHGAKDFTEQVGILRPRFQVGHAPLHAVEPFLAFDQEFACQFIHCVHSSRITYLAGQDGSSRCGKHSIHLSDGWGAT
jgi:hypothetical protein